MKWASPDQAKQRRQLLVFAGLMVIAAFLYFRPDAVPTAGPQGPSNTPAAAAQSPGRPERPALEPQPLKLKDLDLVAVESGGARDPFGFGVPPRPPAPPPPPPAPPPPPVVQAPRPTGPPPRPAIPVKFLGFAEDPSRPGKLVSLLVNGVVVLAREGEVVDGRYRLVKVGLESIVMSYLDGQGQQTIRQSGL